MVWILKLLIPFILMLCMCGPVSSATIHGMVYEWYTLEPLKNAIIDVNSTPPQRFVAGEGGYEFKLDRGQYLMEIRYYEDNELIYYCLENLSIDSDGDFIFDIILFPDLDLNERFFEDLNVNLSIEESLLAGEAEAEDDGRLVYLGAVVFITLLLMISIYILRYRVKPKKNESPGILPDDLGEVVGILRRNGGRMTQRELRRELHYSEAKVSLMLSDLENRGLVERFKRGRGNVLILK